MPTTTNYGWYTPPLTGVTPNVPRDSKTLADAMDVSLKAEETARIAGDAMVQSSRGHAAALSTTSATFTTVPFDTSVLDEIPWTGSTSNYWTVPTAGYYLISAQAHFSANATGVRTVRINVNGTSVAYNQIPAVSGVGCGPSVTYGYKAAANDQVQIQIYQNSGGALTTAGGAAFTRADITRVGR